MAAESTLLEWAVITLKRDHCFFTESFQTKESAQPQSVDFTRSLELNERKFDHLSYPPIRNSLNTLSGQIALEWKCKKHSSYRFQYSIATKQYSQDVRTQHMTMAVNNKKLR